MNSSAQEFLILMVFTVYYVNFEECQLAGNTTKFRGFLSPFPRCNAELSKYAGREKRKVTA